MFPGQEYETRAFTTSAGSSGTGTPSRCAASRTKCRARRRTSPPRSRSGGRARTMGRRRYMRSSRNSPAATRRSRSTLAALSTRTFARRTSVSPTRRYSFSWTKRSSLAWPRGVSSATSSMKSVPPSARATYPSRAETAPVKAPRTCPNSSASNSSSDRDDALMATNGPAPRRERRWMAAATLSFPVPVSPKMWTETSESVTRAISAKSACMAGPRPTSSGKAEPGCGPAISRSVPSSRGEVPVGSAIVSFKGSPPLRSRGLGL